MGKIKVAHLTFDMRIGGTEQVIKSLIENADPHQLDMSILCIETPLGPFADDLISSGTSITSFTRSPGFDRNLIKKIRSHIKEHNITVLHCHQYTPWVYGVLAAFATATKVVFTEHGRFYPDSSNWKRKLINPLLHKITAATTAISSATKDALATHENLPIKDIQVIYNGISSLVIDQNQVTQLRKSLDISEKTLCLGTVARLDPIKNHSMMLKAFRQVLDSGIDAKLLIVGDGEMRDDIEVLIKTLSLSQQVIMTGYQAKPHHHLALMDIYLLSSLSEGTSMTLLEAMSIGKPCVVTDAGGNPEIIKHGINGLVTPNDNANAFANGIVIIATDTSSKESMAKKAYQIFEEKFSATSMVAQFHSLYKKITL
ncbi:MAG: glycosyltransferase [Gammaproteobacteria bacterium]|nr:glycosyltransferase [Gammaproteobacteria bacterium]